MSSGTSKRVVEGFVASAVFLVLGWLLLTTRSGDPERTRRHREIAQACLEMRNSTLTNEFDIELDDPRMPAVIRELDPAHLEIGTTDVVVLCSGSPAEYHLVRDSDAPGTWILYCAGEGGDHRHVELLRIRDTPSVR